MEHLAYAWYGTKALQSPEYYSWWVIADDLNHLYVTKNNDKTN